MRNAAALDAIASPAWATEVGQFNLEINVPPRTLDGDALATLETELRSDLNAADVRGPHRRQPPGHGRHPAHAGRTRRGRDVHVGQRTLQGAQRADLRRPRRGHADRDRRRRAAAHPHRQHHARVRLHQRAAAHPGQPGRLRGLLERGPVHRGRAGRAGRQLPVPVRQAAVARDQDHPVRAGHRHPLGRAEGAGGAPPGVVRGTLDHLGVRPVRGEPQVLPGAAADLRGRGPAGRARRRRHPGAGRDEPAQRDDLPLEPPRLRHRRRAPAPAGGEPGAAGRADHRRRHRQRGVLLRPGPQPWPRRTGRSGPSCPSPPRPRTCTRPRGTAWTPSCTGRAWATRRSPS